MIVTRTKPNTHSVAGVTFHPGAQFIADDFYNKQLKENADFKAQVKVGFLTIDVQVAEQKNTAAISAQTLASLISTLPEDKAVNIVNKTVDAIDLKEIAAHDKRRTVVQAAEKQIEERQTYMNGMAPKMPVSAGSPLSLGEHE